jgi:hypothetical protein
MSLKKIGSVLLHLRVISDRVARWVITPGFLDAVRTNWSQPSEVAVNIGRSVTEKIGRSRAVAVASSDAGKGNHWDERHEEQEQGEAAQANSDPASHFHGPIAFRICRLTARLETRRAAPAARIPSAVALIQNVIPSTVIAWSQRECPNKGGDGFSGHQPVL